MVHNPLAASLLLSTVRLVLTLTAQGRDQIQCESSPKRNTRLRRVAADLRRDPGLSARRIRRGSRGGGRAGPGVGHLGLVRG